MRDRILNDGDLLEFTRWNTCTVYNGWEAVTKKNHMECRTNWENVIDYTPQIKSAIGYAVTCEFRTDDEDFKLSHPDNFKKWFEFIGSIPGPKVIVYKDISQPGLRGATCGELLAAAYKNLGCVGVITDGAVRDIDESFPSGIKMLATRLMVGHGYCTPVRWGMDIDILGTTVKTGDLIHLDKYGFIIIEEEAQAQILETTRRLDRNELQTVISTMYGRVQNADVLKSSVEASIAALDVQAELNEKVMLEYSPKCKG